ncbi:MAG: hypothetical protein ACK4IK_02555 [Bacteroidia bacterium]
MYFTFFKIYGTKIISNSVFIVKKLLLIFLLILSLKGFSQIYNYGNTEKRNIINTSIPQLFTLGYARISDTSARVLKIYSIQSYLNNTSFSKNANQINSDIDLGAHFVLVNKHRWKLISIYNVLAYYAKYEQFQSSSFSHRLNLTGGLYQNKYFFALNIGVNNPIAYYIKYSSFYYEQLHLNNNGLKPGWHNKINQIGFYSGLQAGYSIKRFDFIVRNQFPLNNLRNQGLSLQINYKF